MAKDVEFTARVEGGTVVWDCPDGKPAKEHKTHVDKGAPPEKIDFRLKDKTGLGLAFDSVSPIHAWEQEGCPPSGLETDQIEVKDCKSGRLTIVDRNTGPERTIHYQLNVVAQDGSSHHCDPIIQNGGAGPGFV
jgi:hypothetical protein